MSNRNRPNILISKQIQFKHTKKHIDILYLVLDIRKLYYRMYIRVNAEIEWQTWIVFNIRFSVKLSWQNDYCWWFYLQNCMTWIISRTTYSAIISTKIRWIRSMWRQKSNSIVSRVFTFFFCENSRDLSLIFSY